MKRGIYNPTSDAVWLAAYAPTDTKTVLDVGIGTGGASLCLMAHNPTATYTGIDVSQEMLDACAENVSLNNKKINLINADILTWSTSETFDLVITNPPYFNGTPAKHNAHHGTNIAKWVKHCAARVRPSGYFCIISDARTLDKIIPILTAKHFGDIQIFPLFSNKHTAERVLVRAKQGVKTGTTIYKGTNMNNESILRSGLTIDMLLARIEAQ